MLYSLRGEEGDGKKQVIYVIKQGIYLAGKSVSEGCLSSLPEHEFSFTVRDSFKILHIPYLSYSVVFIRNN